jgi:hypothetical protein
MDQLEGIYPLLVQEPRKRESGGSYETGSADCTVDWKESLSALLMSYELC